MAFDFKLFKTKKDRDKEDGIYSKWAFPHGEAQRESLMQLLNEVFPNDDSAFRLVQFLTCREIYEEALSDERNQDTVIDMMLTRRRLYKNFIKKKERPVFVALVLADESVGDDGIYPGIGLVLAKAAELTRRSETLQ